MPPKKFTGKARSPTAIYAAVGRNFPNQTETAAQLDTNILNGVPATRQIAEATNYVAAQIRARKDRPLPKGMTMQRYVDMHTEGRFDTRDKYMRRFHRIRESASEMSGTTSGVGSSLVSSRSGTGTIDLVSESSGAPGYSPKSIVDLISTESETSNTRRQRELDRGDFGDVRVDSVYRIPSERELMRARAVRGPGRSVESSLKNAQSPQLLYSPFGQPYFDARVRKESKRRKRQRDAESLSATSSVSGFTKNSKR